MAITVREILETTEDGVRAIVDHEGRRIDAVVVGDLHEIAGAVGAELTVEMDYDAVVAWEVVASDPEAHGLFPTEGGVGAVRIVGDVITEVPLDDGDFLLDAYLRSGPEFLTFDANDLPGQRPKVGDGIAATVRGLRFFPARL